MRILIFIQNLGMGGVIRQLSYLAPQLKKRGHDVSVLALYENDRDWEHIRDGEPLEVRTLLRQESGTGFLGAISAIKVVSELIRILKNENIEILYSMSGNTVRIISWVAARTLPDIKLVWGFRGSGRDIRPFGRIMKYTLPLYIHRWLSPSIPLAIANSYAGLSFRERSGHRFFRRTVVHNGIDTAGFKPDNEARSRLRSEWKVSGEEKLIGIAGRIVPSKGYPAFIEAASYILKERTDVRFVCTGSGGEAYRKEMELLGSEFGLDSRLIWAGVRMDMPSVYNAIDILCSSSNKGEGFPNVIGEAMACGKPCVVTDVGDSARIVGESGIAVPPGDPKLLANGMMTVLDGLSDMDPLKIRSRIVRNFGIEKMVDETEKALQDVLDGG